jgi:hypothetical protein
MAKTETVTKLDFITQINEKWKKEQQCYDEAKVEGKDSRTGKKASGTWPRNKPIDQVMYETWLQKVTDPDTGKFYEQRDPKTGNTIKATGPKHLIRQIVRIRTSDGKEHLYSNGKLTGFDVLGEVATVNCSNLETFGQPINISNNRGSSECPSISISNNKLHIVWKVDTLGNHEIYYKSMDGTIWRTGQSIYQRNNFN